MSQENNKKSLNFFSKTNYTWMLIGAALILIGMLLMSGGKSADPNVSYCKDMITVAAPSMV